MASKKALVVDNDRLYVELLSDILEEKGYAVIKAFDGMEALEIIKQEPPPAVVFTDLIMPKVDGTRLCRFIKEDPLCTGIPVVVLSATVVESKPTLLSIGADAYVPKGPLEEVKKNIIEVLRCIDEEKPLGGVLLPDLGTPKSRVIVSELLSHKRHMQLVIQRIGEGVIEVDGGWRVIWMNAAALEIFEKQESQVVGSQVTDLFETEAIPELADLQAIISTTRNPTQQTRTISQGRRTLKLTVSNLFAERKNMGFLILVQDITPLFDQIKALQETQSGLFDSAKLSALGQLSANLSHEINSHLTNILGYSSLLIKETAEDNPRRKILSLMHDEAFRARNFIKDFINMVYQTEPKAELLSLVRELESVVTLARSRAQLLGVTISEHYKKELPLLEGYSTHLKLAFLNIINNAFDAMPHGGELIIDARANGDHVLIRFEDSGCGIPPTAMNKLFNPFFTTKDRTKYFGLGLPITLQIVKRHHGSIEFESDEGAGTVLTVRLPLQGKEKVQRA